MIAGRNAYIFMDGGYIRGILKSLGEEEISENYRTYKAFLLHEHIVGSHSMNYLWGTVRREKTFYYDAIPTEGDPKRSERKAFFDNLQNMQISDEMFEVKLGDLVRTEDKNYPYRQKGIDTLIAIGMLTKAFLNFYDVAYLIAGDRDFVNVVNAAKDFTGKVVVGIYEPSSAAKELVSAFDRRNPLQKEKIKKLCTWIKEASGEKGSQ